MQKIKITFYWLIIFGISLFLTYHLTGINNNVIDRTFNTTNMFALIGFSLALLVYVSDVMSKIMSRADINDTKYNKIIACVKEIISDLKIIFICMIAIFISEVFNDLKILENLYLNIFYGELTKSSLVFLVKSFSSITSLFCVWDIFQATIKLSQLNKTDYKINKK